MEPLQGLCARPRACDAVLIGAGCHHATLATFPGCFAFTHASMSKRAYDIVPGRTLAAASGQRVDRVDRRIQSVHCPPPEDRAADRNRRGWLPRMGAWRRLLLPGAEPMAVLSGPAPGCADTGGNDKAVVRFARPQHWGSSRRNVLIGRRTFSSSVAGSEKCPGDLPTPKFEAIGASSVEDLPIGRGTRLKCGLDRLR